MGLKILLGKNLTCAVHEFQFIQGPPIRTLCPHSTYGVYTQQRMRGRITVSGADRMTKAEFGMHDVPRCLDNYGEKHQGVGLSGAQESKEADATLAGYSRKVTPWVFMHRCVRPLDGWMVANPYHQRVLLKVNMLLHKWKS